MHGPEITGAEWGLRGTRGSVRVPPYGLLLLVPEGPSILSYPPNSCIPVSLATFLERSDLVQPKLIAGPLDSTFCKA